MIGNVIQPNGESSGGNPFSNLTRFFYTECLKSQLLLRDDKKGYASIAWSADLSTAQINTLNSSKCVYIRYLGQIPGLGLTEMYNALVYPQLSNQTFFFSFVNQIYPNRWVQGNGGAGNWTQWGVISSELYENMNNSDVALAYEYYIIA